MKTYNIYTSTLFVEHRKGRRSTGQLFISNFRKLGLLFPAAALLFTSCEDVVDVKLNEEDTGLYAVEARITNAEEPTVFVCKALPVTVDEDYSGVSDAEVTIIDNEDPASSMVLVESLTKKGLYQVPYNTDYYGKAGHSYTVTIATEGVTLTASDTLMPVEKIDSVVVRPSLRGEKQFLAVFINSQEPVGPGNYYKWDVYINGELLNDADLMAIASDEFVDGNYVSNLEIFTDFHNPNNPEERRIKKGDKIYVKQNSISKFTYNYYSQMLSQSMGGSLFSVPPANIKGNFTANDGKQVLGMFTAQDVSRSNTVEIDDTIENQLE